MCHPDQVRGPVLRRCRAARPPSEIRVECRQGSPSERNTVGSTHRGDSRTGRCDVRRCAIARALCAPPPAGHPRERAVSGSLWCTGAGACRAHPPGSRLASYGLQLTAVSWRDMAWQVPLADVRLTQADIDAVLTAYRSGWLSMGPRTQEFEAAFAAYLGVRHAVAVANGTAALHLMYAACELGPGDEAVVPSMTFVATAAPLRHLGAVPVFADIVSELEPSLAPDAVDAAIGPATKA